MREAWLEKIELFLKGKMSSEEQRSFERELAFNAELNEAYEIYSSIEQEMLDDEKYKKAEVSLMNSLEEAYNFHIEISKNQNGYHENNPVVSMLPVTEPKRRMRLPTLRKLAVAAIIIGFIVIGVIFYSQNDGSNIVVHNKRPDTIDRKKDTFYEKPPPAEIVNEDKPKPEKNNRNQEVTGSQNDELFAQNFRPDAAPEDKEGPLEDALLLYEQRRYKSAITAIATADYTDISRDATTDSAVTKFYADYYKALSYMATGDVRKAIPLFKNVNCPTALYCTKVEWFQALAYLKTGDTKHAIALLKQIAGDKKATRYKLRAAILVSTLEKD